MSIGGLTPMNNITQKTTGCQNDDFGYLRPYSTLQLNQPETWLTDDENMNAERNCKTE